MPVSLMARRRDSSQMAFYQKPVGSFGFIYMGYDSGFLSFCLLGFLCVISSSLWA